MAILAPPRPPISVTTGDDGRLHRLRFRLWQVFVTMITVLATVWIMLLGVPILSITAVAVAKHVLVAVYIMGLHAYPVHQ